MKYWGIAVLMMVFIASCDTSGVKKKAKDSPEPEISGPVADKEDPKEVDLDADHIIVDKKALDNGIAIKWFEHGEGEQVKNGDMIDIDYKVYLEDGKLVDGNSLNNMKSFPFMVGFQMQGEGWDIMLKELKIGDFVEVFLPAALARGEKEIEGWIPKNSNNILKIRVLGKKKATREIDGTRIWMLREEPANTMKFDEKKRILFHCWASSPSNPLFFNTEIQNNPYNYGMEDSGLIPGLHKALINAKKADLMLVHVPADQAYGSKGYLDLVKPNEDLFYRVMIMEIRDK